MKNQLIILKNNKMTITSLELVNQVNVFREAESENREEKRATLAHSDLLKVIRDEFEEEIGEGEISESSYVNTQNKKQPMYILTSSQAKQVLVRESKYVRKALIAYIERLETFLREKQSAQWQTAHLQGKKTRKLATDAIRDKLIPLAIEQGSTNYTRFYTVYSKMINDLLGIHSDQRESLPYHYLATIDMLERIIENIISAGVDKATHYKEIYHICKAKCYMASELSFLPKLKPIALIAG